jgi:hypothetical protein
MSDNHDYIIVLGNDLGNKRHPKTKVKFEIRSIIKTTEGLDQGYCKTEELNPGECKKVEINNAPFAITIKITPEKDGLIAPRKILYNVHVKPECKIKRKNVQATSMKVKKKFWIVTVAYKPSRKHLGDPVQTPVTVTDKQA